MKGWNFSAGGGGGVTFQNLPHGYRRSVNSSSPTVLRNIDFYRQTPVGHIALQTHRLLSIPCNSKRFLINIQQLTRQSKLQKRLTIMSRHFPTDDRQKHPPKSGWVCHHSCFFCNSFENKQCTHVFPFNVVLIVSYYPAAYGACVIAWL